MPLKRYRIGNQLREDCAQDGYLDSVAVYYDAIHAEMVLTCVTQNVSTSHAQPEAYVVCPDLSPAERAFIEVLQ